MEETGGRRRRSLAHQNINAGPTPGRPLKQRRLNQDPGPETLRSFWDSLPRIEITPRALREFRRRKRVSSPPLRSRSQLSRADLTAKQYKLQGPGLDALKRFARHGGPDLALIRGYSPQKSNLRQGMGPRGVKPKNGSATQPDQVTQTKKSSAYDANFQLFLIDHGIFPADYDGHDQGVEKHPRNLDEIHKRLKRRRSSLTRAPFTHDDFLDFKKSNRELSAEDKILNNPLYTLAGKSKIFHEEKVLFNHLGPLIGDGSLSMPKPDFYDGSRPECLDRSIRKQLELYIVPCNDDTRPCVPNFFLESKGPKGDPIVCERQAWYDGTLGARGMHELFSFANTGQKFDRNAYTISATFAGGRAGGLLCIYTHHLEPSSDPRRSAEYWMTSIDRWDLLRNEREFCDGVSALRNARDWAQEQRAEAIRAANARFSSPQSIAVEAVDTHEPQPTTSRVSKRKAAIPSEASAKKSKA